MAVTSNKVLDINRYVKRNYEDIKEDILKLANPDLITTDYLVELFSNKADSQNDKGEIIVDEPKYRVTDWFDLPAKVLRGQDNPVETTFGIFIFNSLCIANPFNGKVQYINEELNAKIFGKLNSKISQCLMENIITPTEYGEYVNTVLWLGYQTELFMPGVSTAIVIPNKKVAELKKKLLDEHPEFKDTNKQLTTNDIAIYTDEIEKPLLKLAKEEIANDPGARLMELKKPSFGNNYKNSCVENGPMIDSTTGGYRANNNSFQDGVTPDNFDLLANKTMFASYSRGVNTAVGGTFAKYTNSMMQAVVLDPPGSDCHTEGYLNYTVTKDNMSSIRYNFALVDGKLTRLTDDVMQKLIGKTIKMRSPLFCKSKTGICNKCAGDTFYIIGIKNIGLTSNIPMNASLNKSMKAMHDLSIHTTSVNLEDYMEFE